MKMGELSPKGVLGQMSRVRERANILIERELAARGMTGIVPAHGSVLQVLFQQHEPVPIKSVVQAVGRVKSTVTGIMKTLERHGYVEKTPSEKDGRVTYVKLTRKGQALRAGFDEISRELLEQLYGSMPREDRQVLVRLLAQLVENLGPLRGGRFRRKNIRSGISRAN